MKKQIELRKNLLNTLQQDYYLILSIEYNNKDTIKDKIIQIIKRFDIEILNIKEYTVDNAIPFKHQISEKNYYLVYTVKSSNNCIASIKKQLTLNISSIFYLQFFLLKTFQFISFDKFVFNNNENIKNEEEDKIINLETEDKTINS